VPEWDKDDAQYPTAMPTVDPTFSAVVEGCPEVPNVLLATIHEVTPGDLTNRVMGCPA
jgi:hypothetical protein